MRWRSRPQAADLSSIGPAIRRLVDQVAERVGLDRKLAHAVVDAESNYKPLAISPRGAMGLMQIMPALVRQYGLDDPFDPDHNLEAGMKHLRACSSDSTSGAHWRPTTPVRAP